MKNWNWISFVAGIVAGIILMIGIGYFLSTRPLPENKGANGLPGLTMLNEGEKGSEINSKNIKVMQTLTPNTALTETSEDLKHTSDMVLYNGPVVLYIAPENERLYDDQVITIPDGKKLVQVGTYRYETKKGDMRTVAAVEIK